jgi:hypothetical protein
MSLKSVGHPIYAGHIWYSEISTDGLSGGRGLRYADVPDFRAINGGLPIIVRADHQSGDRMLPADHLGYRQQISGIEGDDDRQAGCLMQTGACGPSFADQQDIAPAAAVCDGCVIPLNCAARQEQLGAGIIDVLKSSDLLVGAFGRDDQPAIPSNPQAMGLDALLNQIGMI